MAVARVYVRSLGRISISKRGALVHAPTFRYGAGRYWRNVILLIRRWRFR
jgi:hypothetical protein